MCTSRFYNSSRSIQSKVQRDATSEIVNLAFRNVRSSLKIHVSIVYLKIVVAVKNKSIVNKLQNICRIYKEKMYKII